MRIRNRLVRFLIWGMVLTCSILAGGAWFAYSYFTDSETAKRVIRLHAQRFLPGSTLDMSSVDMQLSAGVIKIKYITLKQSIDGETFPTLNIPFLQVKLNPKKVLHGEFQAAASEIIVSQPKLQLCRREDGTWNIQGLLADPWPVPAIKDPPPIVIKNGTIELRVESSPESEPPLTDASPAPGSADPSPPRATKIVDVLRDVDLTIKSVGPDSTALEFVGSAKGDHFERISLEGEIDPATGKLTIEGDLSRLTLSEKLLERIPREARPAVSALGLTGGEVNLSVDRLEYDPSAEADKRLHYDATARLNAGVWECKHLPFPVTELSAQLTARDGELTIEHAEGRNGMTSLRVTDGKLRIGDPQRMPFDIQVDLIDLMLDDRLRKRTPPEYDELWDVFKAKGKVDAAVHVVREKVGGLVGVGATVVCRDVSGVYRHFPYPIDHMTGELKLEGKILKVSLNSHIGGKPIALKGTIDNPGPDAIVNLDIEAESVPVDETLMDALPPDVRKVVDQFKPTGSAKASVKIFRKPTIGPMTRPEGDFELHALIDLQEQCSIRWEGFPYPVRNLTGQLTIHPDLWQFKNMRGDNGQSIITASGRVDKLPLPKLSNGEEPLKVEVAVNARNLLFDDVLRDSLQPAWRKTWNTINPTGSTDVNTTVKMEPGMPDLVHIELRPLPKANIRLVVPTLDPNFTPVLPMEDVNGLFVFHNNKVTMTGANFEFRGAPVSFERGTVFVEDSGRFELSVGSLRVKQIRVDSGFRKIMPQMMASFARRLDDGRTFTALGDLEIGWSGVPKEPAWCRWQNTKAFFNDNTVQAGIPLEHIQGQLEQVSGRSDGKSLEVAGKMRLASINILGQQITGLNANFSVDSRRARMEEIQGALLGGRLSGKCWVSLDSPNAPRYGTELRLQDAGLEQYGLTVPGRQTYRGQLNAGLAIVGLGTSIRSLRGNGWAKVTHGDLGQLPVVFRFAKFFNENVLRVGTRSTPKTAFDEANVEFQIHDGVTTMSPITFTGNAFRLIGDGTLDPQGNLDIGLRVGYGRGSFRLPLISDALNEASKEIVGVRVQGTVSAPSFEVKPLPDLMRSLGGNRSGSAADRPNRIRPISR
jgi:hypothetical protein